MDSKPLLYLEQQNHCIACAIYCKRIHMKNICTYIIPLRAIIIIFFNIKIYFNTLKKTYQLSYNLVRMVPKV